MSKIDELKGKAKAAVDNIQDGVEDTKEDLGHKTDEAKGYAEARKT